MTPTERGDLAERLLPIAAKLACVAHGDGDWHDIDHHTAHMDRAELVALVAVLAALVDPGQRIDDALGYVTWDEHGRTAPALSGGRKTIRGLAHHIEDPKTLSVDAVMESERRMRARHLYLHDGLSVAEVARRVGAAEPTVKAWRDAGGWRQVAVVTDADARRTRGLVA